MNLHQMNVRSSYQSLKSFVRRLERAENPRDRVVADALERTLTERQKQMLRLYYLEQIPMKEIARLLGVNQSTVSRTLKTVREKLEVCLRYAGAFLPEED